MRTVIRIGLTVSVALLALCAWCLTLSKQATVRISPTAFARFESREIYQLFASDDLPLTYFEDGVRVGEVRFAQGAETYPEGIFPGSDSQTLICVYGTDLTVGVFAVELNKRSERAVAPPQGMFKSSIVKSTDFGLRRCTRSEVDQLRQFIDSASGATFREMTYPGGLFNLRGDKNSLLKEIEYGSGLYHKYDCPAGQCPEVEPDI